MSNGINNPYQTQSDYTLDDLLFHGTAQEIDRKRDRIKGIGNIGTKTYWDPEYGFEGSLADLNLTDEQISLLQSILPGQGYQYNLASPIMDALGQVFTGGFDLNELTNTLTREQYIAAGLDPYTYTHIKTDGDYVERTGEDGEGFDPTIRDIQIGGVPFVDIFDPESIASTLSTMKGHEGSIMGSDVEALTTDMIEKTESPYYQPYEFAQREDLVNQLAKTVGKTGTGGFAGSGGRMADMTAADRMYRGGYQDLLASINKMKAQSMDDVMQTVYGWKELYENA